MRNYSFKRNMGALHVVALLLVSESMALGGEHTRSESDIRVGSAIPWSDLGAQAGAQYLGDGLSITATEDGAWLRCVFQRLEGHATSEGLWLTSTDAAQRVAGSLPLTDGHDRFRVTARAFGRENLVRELPTRGSVSAHSAPARFTRPGVTEEYSVSADGVRQDFVIAQPPPGDGQLLLELEVTGAQAEGSARGARLVLPSGRRIAYSRLHVTDATGRELSARIEVGSASLLRVSVDDEQAAYPLRIDPTFSDDNWIPMGGVTGANDSIFNSVTDDSGNLYVCGDFTAIGDTLASQVAKWDGNEWQALGEGLSGNSYSLALIGTNLFAGGWFLKQGLEPFQVARWDGVTWQVAGRGFDRAVWLLMSSGGQLYAGGEFSTFDGTEVNGLAVFDGEQWTGVGGGVKSNGGPGHVGALAMRGSDLFVGGYFDEVGGVAAEAVARWDGHAWHALGAGLGAANYSPLVSSFVVSGSDLYVGGDFETAGNASAFGIAKWDGNTWSSLGGGLQNDYLGSAGIYAMEMLGSDLYVAGDFRYAGGNVAYSMAKWSAGQWVSLFSHYGEGDIYTLSRVGEKLFAGGSFRRVGNTELNFAAFWNGSTWEHTGVSENGDGLNGAVWELACSGTNLFVSGLFTWAGSTRTRGTAIWDGSGWNPAGGSEMFLSALFAAASGDVFAGGSGISGDLGTPQLNLAEWDGETWVPFGNGVWGVGGATVGSFAELGDAIFIGGRFSHAGVVPARSVAKWDGASWSPLGSGLSSGAEVGSVGAMATVENRLYVGGFFTEAGGSPATGIAAWDGTTWAGVGGGLSRESVWPGSVSAMAVAGTNLFVGGGFTEAGGIPAQNVARWDGVSWSALGDGVELFVHAMAVGGTNLYVGGFSTASNPYGNALLRWDGSEWTPLGSGLGPGPLVDVSALAIHGPELYVGGKFASAGGKLSSGIARWLICSVEERTMQIDLQATAGSAVIDWPAASVPFQLESAPTVGNAPGEWEPVTTPPVVENGTNRVTVPNAGSQFFRLKYP